MLSRPKDVPPHVRHLVDLLTFVVSRIEVDPEAARSLFHHPPVETLASLLTRVDASMRCSAVCYAVALVYIDRLTEANPGLRLEPHSVARLFCTALLLANQFLDDTAERAVHMAHVAFIPPNTMARLKTEFLFRIGFHLWVSPQDVFKYSDKLQGRLCTRAFDLSPMWSGLPLHPQPDRVAATPPRSPMPAEASVVRPPPPPAELVFPTPPLNAKAAPLAPGMVPVPPGSHLAHFQPLVQPATQHHISVQHPIHHHHQQQHHHHSSSRSHSNSHPHQDYPHQHHHHYHQQQQQQQQQQQLHVQALQHRPHGHHHQPLQDPLHAPDGIPGLDFSEHLPHPQPHTHLAAPATFGNQGGAFPIPASRVVRVDSNDDQPIAGHNNNNNNNNNNSNNKNSNNHCTPITSPSSPSSVPSLNMGLIASTPPRLLMGRLAPSRRDAPAR